MKLVENWKEGYRWISNQCMALSVAILSSWEMIPAEWKSALPMDDVRPYVISLLMLGIVGRFLDQSKKAE